MSAYFDELCRAMQVLADHPSSVFMGQAVAFEGTAMFKTLRDVPAYKRVELPVAEDMQMGMATGAALSGLLPITIYPRWNFLLLATSQLVLHLDKLPAMTRSPPPRVIVRTAVATPKPLDPGPQHLGDFGIALSTMLDTVEVIDLFDPDEIVPAYTAAAARQGSTVLVEHMALY
jgi:pyruvate/2-oxoglutarate/acetoin dehydrogenase E1 component